MPIDLRQYEGLQRLVAYFEQWQKTTRHSVRRLALSGGEAVGYFDDLILKSAYQPLFDAQSMQPFAYEALLRAEDSRGNVAPADAFAAPATPDDIIFFDLLCSMVHVMNFVRQAGPGEALFLNADGRRLLSVGGGRHGSAFEALLAFCNVSPQQIVLEIVESRIDDLGRLVEAVADYQKRGFRVAIDDFGCLESNFDRLWQMSPEFVKLDRSLIVQSTTNPRARAILPKLGEIIHDLDARVVCEGIETPEQDCLARDAGVDLLQGFLYAQPDGALLDRNRDETPVRACGRR